MHILKTYRQSKNLSRRQLAERLEVSHILVASIEAGHRRITPENAKKWEPILGINRAMLCPEVFGESEAA
jgi:transcriptional regulator with XRE-family HTH domain